MATISFVWEFYKMKRMIWRIFLKILIRTLIYLFFWSTVKLSSFELTNKASLSSISPFCPPLTLKPLSFSLPKTRSQTKPKRSHKMNESKLMFWKNYEWVCVSIYIYNFYDAIRTYIITKLVWSKW